MITEVPHTRLGAVKTIGHPVHYTSTPAEIVRGAPILGEHTVEVLAEHGYDADEIDRLVADGCAIAAPAEARTTSAE